MAYLKLIRPVNLLLIILVQFLIKYIWLEPLDIPLALDDFQFGLLVFATVCIAAAGNVVNDILDVPVDRINKPEKMMVSRRITEKAAYNYYIGLTVAGVLAGFYLANGIDRPGLAAVFVIISALLYVYATHLKAILIAGNVLISVLVAMSLIILILFDIYPAITTNSAATQIMAARVILAYAAFAFFINLIREIVKDLQDIDGDKNGGRRSIPILLGRKRTVNLIFVLGVVALLVILIYTYQVLYQFQMVALYFVFLIAAPLLYFCIKAWNTETKKHYAVLSRVLKIIMLTGMCSLIFYAEIATQL